MDTAGQAAWFQAFASVFAIGVAVFIPWRQRHIEAKDRLSDHRKRVMSAAAILDTELRYQTAVLDFASLGDGETEHGFTFAQAATLMKLRPAAQAAIRSTVAKAHYFSDELCEQIVRLGVEAAAYDRIIEEALRRYPFQNAHDFFDHCRPTTTELQSRMERVRSLLEGYLPKGGW